MSVAATTDRRSLAGGDLCWWAALAIALAWLAWPLPAAIGSGDDGTTVARPTAAGAATTPSARPVPVSAADAAGWHWFGVDDATAGPAPVVKAEDTHLNLQLIGVATGDDAKASLALLRINGQVASYRVGARLPVGGDVRITAVAHNRILLNHNGEREQLLLYRFSDGDRHGNAGEPTQAASGGREAAARRHGDRS